MVGGGMGTSPEASVVVLAVAQLALLPLYSASSIFPSMLVSSSHALAPSSGQLGGAARESRALV